MEKQSIRVVLCAHGNGDKDQDEEWIDLRQYKRRGHSVKIIFDANKGNKCYVNKAKTQEILGIMSETPESQIHDVLMNSFSTSAKPYCQCIPRIPGTNGFDTSCPNYCPNYMITLERDPDLIETYGWGIWASIKNSNGSNVNSRANANSRAKRQCSDNRGCGLNRYKSNIFQPGSTISLKDFIDIFIISYHHNPIYFVGYFCICRGDKEPIQLVYESTVAAEGGTQPHCYASNEDSNSVKNGGGSRRKRKRRTKKFKKLKKN